MSNVCRFPFVWLIVVSVLSALVGCSGSTPVEVTEDGWFQVNRPSKWKRLKPSSASIEKREDLVLERVGLVGAARFQIISLKKYRVGYGDINKVAKFQRILHKKKGVSVSGDGKPLKINGYPAIQVEGTVKGATEELKALLTVIESEESFHFAVAECKEKDFESLKKEFTEITNSFCKVGKKVPGALDRGAESKIWSTNRSMCVVKPKSWATSIMVQNSESRSNPQTAATKKSLDSAELYGGSLIDREFIQVHRVSNYKRGTQEAIMKLLMSKLKTRLDSFKVVADQKLVTKDGIDFVQQTISGKEDGQDLVWIFAIVDIDQIGFQIVCWTTKKNYEKRQAELEKVVHSFRLKSYKN